MFQNITRSSLLQTGKISEIDKISSNLISRYSPIVKWDIRFSSVFFKHLTDQVIDEIID